MSDRERLSVLLAGSPVLLAGSPVLLAGSPVLKADAIVVLCGEDGYARCKGAFEAFKQGVAPIVVLSGALDSDPRWLGATRCARLLMGWGVEQDRLIIDDKAQHTRDQAANVVKMAKVGQWKRLLVIASPYHVPRAYLTFVKALQEAKRDQDVHVVMLSAYVHWADKPAGVDCTRLDLLDTEFAKIEEYAAKGHVASYADGLEYFLRWEKAA